MQTFLPETMMTDTDPAMEEANLFPKTAGERLREAREGQGLALTEIAARTRVPVRQLEAIENDNYSALPSVTYSVGFAKAYARAVGLDEVAIAREVRGQSDKTARRAESEVYQFDDPKRTPTGRLVIGSAAVVVLLLVAIGLWYGTNLFRGIEQPASAPVIEAEIMPPAPVAAPTPTAPVGGQVVLTATDQVWLRIYDATGKTLFENTLQPGERYEVPGDANGPMINVGRPDKLQITLNGSALPPLGDGRIAIKDVPVGAVALQARASGTPTPTPTPTGQVSSDGTVPAAFRDSLPRHTRHTERSASRPKPSGPTDATALPVVTPPPAAPTPAP